MVNIFILNWQSLNSIKKRVQEINDIKETLRVIVINNDSESIQSIEMTCICDCHELHVVNNGGNLGYAGGNNAGYEYLKKNNLDGDVIIANPDVSLSPEVIHSLLGARGLENFGAAMTAAHDEEGSILYRYITMSGFGQKWKCDQSEQIFFKTDYVAGSLFIISREVLDKIGLFDERYFLYWEEVDLSFRIKDMGFELYSLTAVSIFRETNTLARIINSQYYLARNHFLLKNKFPRRFKNLDSILYIANLIASNIRFSLKSGTIKPLINVFKGLLDGLTFK